MTLDDSIHAQRLRILREAERSGDVSATCRWYELSRTVFYCLRQRLRPVRSRRGAPKASAGSAGSASATGGPDGAAHPGPGHRLADVRAAVVQRPAGPRGAAGGPGHHLAAVGPARRGDATPTPGHPRSVQRDDHGAADRTDRAPSGAKRAARSGPEPQGLVVARHVLRRQAEGRRQGLATDGLRCGLVLWVSAPRRGRGHRGRRARVSARGGAPHLPPGGVPVAARVDRSRKRIQRGLRDRPRIP